MNKKSKGFTLVELLVVIGILGILMGVLVPTVTSAIATSNLNAMAMNGSKLVKAIAASGLSSGGGMTRYYPHLSEDDGLEQGDSDRVYGMKYSTSTDYFKKLFDFENRTGSNWDPSVDEELLGTLWGFGVPPASGSSLNAGNVAWTVAAGMTDTLSGKVPFMVSRNVDTSNFVKSGNQDMSTKKDKPSLEKKPQPFGKKGAVIVYKDGVGVGLKASDARLCDIYSPQQNIQIPNGITLEYLEP